MYAQSYPALIAIDCMCVRLAADFSVCTFICYSLARNQFLYFRAVNPMSGRSVTVFLFSGCLQRKGCFSSIMENSTYVNFVSTSRLGMCFQTGPTLLSCIRLLQSLDTQSPPPPTDLALILGPYHCNLLRFLSILTTLSASRYKFSGDRFAQRRPVLERVFACGKWPEYNRYKLKSNRNVS